VPHNYVESADAIAAVVAHAGVCDAEKVEVTSEAEAAWLVRIQPRQGSVIGSPDCTPGYYNNEGKPLSEDQQLNGAAFVEGPAAYFDYLESWRTSGTFDGLAFS
jgi:cyclohexanone monooxygenase